MLLVKLKCIHVMFASDSIKRLSNSDLCAASLFNPVWSLFVRCAVVTIPVHHHHHHHLHLHLLPTCFFFGFRVFFPLRRRNESNIKAFIKAELFVALTWTCRCKHQRRDLFFLHEIIVNHDSGVLSSTSPSFYLMLNPGTEEEEAAPAEC